MRGKRSISRWSRTRRPRADRDDQALDDLATAVATDEEVRRQLASALRTSEDGRQAIAAAVAAAAPTSAADEPDLPPVPAVIGRRLAGTDPLGRWRRSDRRSLVIIGDSIANQLTQGLRKGLRDALPGGMSFGYAGLAGGALSSWFVTGEWAAVGETGANLGVPATAAAARRCPGSADATLTWIRPPEWVVDDAAVHWVDDAESGPAFSYQVDDGQWVEVGCTAPADPVLRCTSLGPVGSHVVLRAARVDRTAVPSPVVLGLDARDHRAAHVVHSLTFPGGRIAGRPGADADACLRPDRLDVAIAHLARFEPSLILWQTINEATTLDLDRLDAAVGEVERAFPDADHAAVGAYEVIDTTEHDEGQHSLHRYMTERFDAVVDVRARWGSPSDAIAAGLLAPDGIHPTHPRGAGDIAFALAGLLSVEG